MAVVILHAHKYGKKVTREFKSGGLHERHVNLGTISAFACRHRETKKMILTINSDYFRVRNSLTDLSVLCEARSEFIYNVD